VFFQTSPGRFPPLPSQVLGGSTTTDGPNHIVVADFDGDHRLDLVSSNLLGRSITVFLQGDGGFPQVPSFSIVASYPNWVEAADLNEDGRVDLAASLIDGDLLVVHYQTGTGEFPDDPDLVLGDPSGLGQPYAMAVADLDGDGSPDLLSTKLAGDVTAFLHTGLGRFSASPDVVVSAESGARVTVGDLNADGLLDLATANFLGNSLDVTFQDGGGQFGADPDRLVGAGSSLLGPSEVVAADLNGDGLLDLASVNSGGHDVTAFFQMSPGQFSPSPDVTVGGPAWTQFAFRLIAADLDDDGRVDLVTVSFALKKLAVFFQEAPGVFPVQPSQVLDIPASSGGPLALAAADLDGDHLLDLVSANDSPGSLTIFLQTGPRVFSTTPSATLGGPAVPIGFRDILAADLDGNGLLDLVATS
jgi:hypothetical protein